MSRTVLAPEWVTSQGKEVRHWVERGAQGFKVGCEIENYLGQWDEFEQSDYELSDIEARALRDWLCEQFGLPDSHSCLSEVVQCEDCEQPFLGGCPCGECCPSCGTGKGCND